MLVGWMLAAMRERGPYPIAVLTGEQGTGKSTLSRRLRDMVDPGSPAIQGPPKDERDLIVAAKAGHIIALDNISFVDANTSDALCRLSTGGGFATRALHTNDEESLFEGARPMILNGIGELSERADLAERSFKIHLKAISEIDRLPEDELEALWQGAQPKILGVLCDALSCALKNLTTTRLERPGRMADAEKWISAAEPALGWQPRKFSTAYSEHRRDNAEATFEADPVATAVFDWLERESIRVWEGTSTELLAKLNFDASDQIRSLRSWPKNASSMGNALTRAAPLLRAKGFEIQKTHSGTRTTAITRKSGR